MVILGKNVNCMLLEYLDKTYYMLFPFHSITSMSELNHLFTLIISAKPTPEYNMTPNYLTDYSKLVPEGWPTSSDLKIAV